MSVTIGFLVLVEAKPDKANELAALLEQGAGLARDEPLTVNWYSYKIDEVRYGVFDTFETEAGRQAHLVGEITKGLLAAAPDLLAKDPEVLPVDILSFK